MIRFTSNYADAATRGRMRQFKAELSERYSALPRPSSSGFQGVAADFVFKSGIGRRRALAELSRRLAPAHVSLEGMHLGREPVAIWAILKPREAVWIDEADQHGAITVNYISVHKRDGQMRACEGMWSLEITDHTLGRAMHRRPRESPTKVILEAHHRLLRVPTAIVSPGIRFLLPSGPGGFVCSLRVGEDVSMNNEKTAYVYAHTWLDTDMVHGERLIILPDAADDDCERLGESVLLPPPMYRIGEDGLVVMWAPAMAALAPVVRPSALR